MVADRQRLEQRFRSCIIRTLMFSLYSAAKWGDNDDRYSIWQTAIKNCLLAIICRLVSSADHAKAFNLYYCRTIPSEMFSKRRQKPQHWSIACLSCSNRKAHNSLNRLDIRPSLAVYFHFANLIFYRSAFAKAQAAERNETSAIYLFFFTGCGDINYRNFKFCGIYESMMSLRESYATRLCFHVCRLVSIKI